MKKSEATISPIEHIRHSLAHLLAAAVMKLWPDTKRAIGPAIENGFYFDFEFSRPITDADLPAIEKKMREILPAWDTFTKHTLTPAEAKKEYRENPYKHELIEEFSKDAKNLSFYKSGDYWDLCKGGHAESMREIDPNSFTLTKVTKAYWRGDEKNPQLTRIYGLAFATKKELEEHLRMLEEAERRSHRKLGAELELFMFHETAPGMPYWLPKGLTVLNELIAFWRREHIARGYQEIRSPLINKKELYETSGHWEHYRKDMFLSETEEGEIYGLKPMNCPNAMVVFGSKKRSYRELPLRLSDTDILHRHERSGTLNGLFRVREFSQDDAHIFIPEEDIAKEYERIFEIADRFYSVFGIKYSFRLGTRPDPFMGDPKLWKRAEEELKKILASSGKPFAVLERDGAFYGPKVDILMKDAIGREWQMGTIQLDFQIPRRFELTYTDTDGKEQTPVVIHRVIYGSLERFIGVLLEHTAGVLPFWLAPVQARILTISEKVESYGEDLRTRLLAAGIRAALDSRNESIGKKIREGEMEKIPFLLVVGEREKEANKIAIRERGRGDRGTMTIEEFITQTKSLLP